MKIRFFSYSPPQARKNDRRKASISHDLALTFTLPNPQNRLGSNPAASLAAAWRSSHHDA
jgi:hypothetical protein